MLDFKEAEPVYDTVLIGTDAPQLPPRPQSAPLALTREMLSRANEGLATTFVYSEAEWREIVSQQIRKVRAPSPTKLNRKARRRAAAQQRRK